MLSEKEKQKHNAIAQTALISDTVFKLQRQVFDQEQKIHEKLDEIVKLEKRCYKKVEAAKTKVAVLNNPKDVPCMPCLREQGELTDETLTSWMLMTNDLNTKGFHC